MWIAEDVPAYMFDPKAERPWRDEDVAMSAPETIHKGTSYDVAMQHMSDKLVGISQMNYVRLAGETATYTLAAAAFMSCRAHRTPSELDIRIHGRVYRVRHQEKEGE